jgi:lipoprotein-anchoring transpeptidase ErfK/SrfK
MTKTKPARAERTNHRRAILVTCLVTAVLLLGGTGTALATTFYYQDRAHPGVEIGGESVSGLTEPELAAKVTDLTEGKTLTVRLSGDGVAAKSLTVHQDEIGFSVDPEATAHAALMATADRFVLDAYNPFSAKPVTVVTSLDRTKLKTWVERRIADEGLTAADAGVTYDAAATAFAVTPGQVGRTIDTTPLLDALDQWAADPLAEPVVDLEIVEKAPDIADEAAQAAADQANAGLNLTLSVTTDAGAYTVPREALAAWTVLTPDPNKGVITVTHDTAAMRDQLTLALTEHVETEKVDWKLQTAPNGSTLATLQTGQDGIALTDKAGVVDQLVAALDKGENAELQAETQVTEAETVKEPIDQTADGKWFDVNLSNFTVTAYVHDTVANSFFVSYGKPGHETPTGVFQVLRTLKQDRMVGQIDPATGKPEYDLMVDWVSYFTETGVAFHSAPWAAPYGAYVSHGCVNMTPAAAEWVYWWTPPGTPVVVHY